MDFSPGAPVNLSNNAMNSIDNPASISDSLGNLLFYSNGLQVWNRNNIVMANGSGLLGDNTGGHTATAIKLPGSTSIYYLFTMDNVAQVNGLRYSVIDMNLNGGLGDVVAGQKNILLLTPASEQIIPVVHSNGLDIWIIAHPWNSSSFNSYLVTCNGINTTPVVSTVGTPRSNNTNIAQGQINVNATNDRIVTTNWSGGNMELFDFNNSTGVLSNPLLFSGLNQPWGVEFSPNGSKLYLAGWTTQYVYQYDLSVYTQPAILASQVNLGNVTGPGAPYFTGYLQRAPDGKIYMAVYLDPYLAVINNPDAAGLACNLVDDGYNLGGKLSGAGLPDKVVATFISTIALGNDTTYCGNFSRTLSTGNANTLWSTGVTAAQITVTAPGTYWASIINGCSAGASDTITIAQIASPVVNLGNDTSLCTGQSLQLDAGNVGSTYHWQDNSSVATYNVSTAGNYAVTVTNAAGCSASDNISVTYVTGPPVINLGNDTTYCGSFSRVLTTGSANTLWSTGVTAAQITASTPATYWAETTNACGTARDSIVFIQLPVPTVFAGNDTSICNGQTILLTAVSPSSNFLWSDGSSGSSLNVSGVGTYWVEVDEAGCTNRDSVIVTAGQIPVFTLGLDTTVCGDELILTLHVSNANYLWQNQSTDSVYHVTSSGVYSVTVSNACGSTADEVNVDIESSLCAILVPTGFSPNNDGANDVFRAISRCPVTRYSMHVFNRWGEEVYTTEDISEGWNGIFRNKEQPLGVYVYYINYFNYCEQKMKTVVGNVTLVR